MKKIYTMLKPRLIIVFLFIFVSILLLQMGFFVAHEIWEIESRWNIFQYCLSFIGEKTSGHLFVKIIFNLVILYTTGRMVWRILNQIYLSVKWTRIFHNRKHSKLTKKLNYKYRDWNVKFIVVRDDSFIALTMGTFRPRIVVSSEVLASFSPSEIQVILQHERYHCTHYDPLKILLSTMMVDGLGYVPIIKNFHHYYKTWKELMADRFVIKKMGTEYDLGIVLLKLSQMNNISRPEIGVPFADVAFNYRMLQFLHPEIPVNVPFLQFRPVMISFFVLTMMSIVVLGGCS
jgi:hypothetical protein